MVVAIEFGLDAYFIFEMKKEEQVLVKAGGSLRAKLPKISIGGGVNAHVDISKSTNKVHISCKYHGDFSLGDENLVTFENVIKIYKNLPKIAKCATTVPQRVWLYPLATLNGKAAKIAQSVSVRLIEMVENQSQKLLNTRAKVNALLEDNIIESLPFLQTDLKQFIRAIDLFDIVFKEYLCKILPEIRGAGKDQGELSKLLQLLEASPLAQIDEFTDLIY